MNKKLKKLSITSLTVMLGVVNLGAATEVSAQEQVFEQLEASSDETVVDQFEIDSEETLNQVLDNQEFEQDTLSVEDYRKEDALNYAKMFLDDSYGGISLANLTDNMINAGYEESDIVHVLSSIEIDWNDQALKFSYKLVGRGVTESQLKGNLEVNGFVESEIDFVMANIKIDSNAQALESAQRMVDGQENGISRVRIKQYLSREGFNDEIVRYALENISVDWNEQL